jgi:hypothetical protein
MEMVMKSLYKSIDKFCSEVYSSVILINVFWGVIVMYPASSASSRASQGVSSQSFAGEFQTHLDAQHNAAGNAAAGQAGQKPYTTPQTAMPVQFGVPSANSFDFTFTPQNNMIPQIQVRNEHGENIPQQPANQHISGLTRQDMALTRGLEGATRREDGKDTVYEGIQVRKGLSDEQKQQVRAAYAFMLDSGFAPALLSDGPNSGGM